MNSKIAQEIKDLFLFQLLEKDELEEILNFFREKVYASGMKIFSQDDKGETMFVVKTGAVKITIREGGREKELITFAAGEFFGEIAIFEYAMRTATASAAEETSLLEINRSDFNRLFAQKPQIAAKLLYQMMSEMSRRLRRKNMQGGSLIF